MPWKYLNYVPVSEFSYLTSDKNLSWLQFFSKKVRIQTSSYKILQTSLHPFRYLQKLLIYLEYVHFLEQLKESACNVVLNLSLLSVLHSFYVKCFPFVTFLMFSFNISNMLCNNVSHWIRPQNWSSLRSNSQCSSNG